MAFLCVCVDCWCVNASRGSFTVTCFERVFISENEMLFFYNTQQKIVTKFPK